MGAGGGRDGTLLRRMLGHWLMKAANHTSEILIRMLGRAEAVTLAMLLGLPSTLHSHTHAQFTPLRNHYSSAETDTAITWKARKTPLQGACCLPL